MPHTGPWGGHIRVWAGLGWGHIEWVAWGRLGLIGFLASVGANPVLPQARRPLMVEAGGVEGEQQGQQEGQEGLQVR